MFISNNPTFFHLWWIQKLVKDGKVSKYYQTDCLQNFSLLLMILLTAKLVQNNHNYARIFFIFLKNVLKQTWNSFYIKFQPQWKDEKRSYQVKTILGLFCQVKLFHFYIKIESKVLELTKASEKISLKGSGSR